MSVNWNWKDKKGEVHWKPKQEVRFEESKNHTITWSIYHANCLGCMLKEYKNDKGEDVYDFMCYFNDIHHLKRMLGLEKYKSWDNETKQTDWFKDIYVDFEIDYITLDITYPYADKLAKYFAEAGYEVRLYKGERNNE